MKNIFNYPLIKNNIEKKDIQKLINFLKKQVIILNKISQKNLNILKMKDISVAKFIVKKVESWGVKDVPVFQGGAIMNVLSEIGKSKKIKFSSKRRNINYI